MPVKPWRTGGDLSEERIMSYPEHLEYPQPRYHGTKGEVNASCRPAGTPRI